MEIKLARVDERLVHGQIINEWIATIQPTHLIIVDEALTSDPFMMGIYAALVPMWLHTRIFTPQEAVAFLKEAEQEDYRVFLLARVPQTFEKMLLSDVALPEISLADKMYFPNRIKIPQEYQKSIDRMRRMGVRLVAQNHTTDEPEVL